MRNLAFGATLIATFLFQANLAAAQCCGAGAPAAAPAAPAATPAMSCCGDHAAPAAPAGHAGHQMSQAPAAPGAMCCGGGHAADAAPAGPACCGGRMGAPSAAATAPPMACCDHAAAPAAAWRPVDDPAITWAVLGLAVPPPVRYLDVTFRDPVRVARAVLSGDYLIEHDDDRMARGEPCTYIFDANDLRAPVVTFHCEHVERPLSPNGAVVLAPSANPSIKVMQEFQFGGESAAHRVPAVR